MINTFFSIHKKAIAGGIVCGGIVLAALVVFFDGHNISNFFKDGDAVKQPSEQYTEDRVREILHPTREGLYRKMVTAGEAFEEQRKKREDNTVYINGTPSTELTPYRRVGREYFSLGGNFKYGIVCKTDTDACEGGLTEVSTGRTLPITLESPFFFEEKYLFGFGGGAMGADTGLYLVSLEEFDKELEYIELLRAHVNYSNAFKISGIGDNDSYVSEINLLPDRVLFKKTQRTRDFGGRGKVDGERGTIGERTLLFEYFIEIKNPRSNVEVIETVDYLE